MGTTLLERLDQAVVEDKERGIYRCRRDIFTDEALFELEMKHIFEGNWVYLAHESQIPEPNDYFTTSIGRQPIVITRRLDRSHLMSGSSKPGSPAVLALNSDAEEDSSRRSSSPSTTPSKWAITSVGRRRREAGERNSIMWAAK